MCEFASAMIGEGHKVRFGLTDSHADIIEYHKIHVDGVHGPNWVPVECVPPGGDLSAPVDKWAFRTDLPQSQWPKWYDAGEAERAMRHAVEKSGLAPADKAWQEAKATADKAYQEATAPAYKAYASKRKAIADEVW